MFRPFRHACAEEQHPELLLVACRVNMPILETVTLQHAQRAVQAARETFSKEEKEEVEDVATWLKTKHEHHTWRAPKATAADFKKLFCWLQGQMSGELMMGSQLPVC
jgi:hypothetical protein